jgi:DNA-binding NarL/FixJ family response regulator
LAVIAVVDDLFFAARIRETARQVNVEVDLTPTERLGDRLAQGGVDAVILDLGAPSALDSLRTLKTNPATVSAPVVGYASHVATDTIQAARAGGCDEVLARSAFTRQLPDLLRRLVARRR